MALVAALAASLLLVAAPQARGDADAQRRAAAASELGSIAERIEALKARGRSAGPELEELLARAQELASEIERLDRAAAPPRPPQKAGPDPQELHERADLLRDEADRLAIVLRELEARLEDERRRRELESRLDALAEESALFDEAGPNRLSRQRPAGGPALAVDAPPAPGPAKGAPTPSAPQTSGAPASPGTASPTASSSPPTSPALPLSLRTSSGALEALAPRPEDSERTLRAKRDELGRAIEALRNGAEALEAEARRVARER